MLISKFDLYKHEWLELVFDNRNKEYGAYDLRQHYANNMIKAMGITFLGVGLLFGAGVIFKAKPQAAPMVIPDKTTVVHLNKIEIAKPPAPPKKLVESKPSAPVKTQQYTQFVVGPDDKAVNPPKNIELTAAISTTTNNAKGTGELPIIDNNPGAGAQPALPNNTIYSSSGVDIMPAPVGGEAAWAKFLRKNLRFPSEAQDAQVSGRVILSFVIEKDGSLSNIAVERPAGHGFDEEALRVLKLAKAWKPGMQNGQPVRVRYLIPINFQLSSSE
ncbi:MAG TPA: TonB family protein [Mucilaginibacter sp.]|jgi:protein TonB